MKNINKGQGNQGSSRALLCLVLFVILIIYCAKYSQQQKVAKTSFGAYKDYKKEFSQNEYSSILKEMEQYVIDDFRSNPSSIYLLSSREFEEFIAFLYERKGYQVNLTPETKDGGIDIVAEYKLPSGDNYISYVQCKRYNPNCRVGLKAVKELVGTMYNANVHQGIVVTSSRFTKGARRYVETNNCRILLKDFDDIKELLN